MLPFYPTTSEGGVCISIHSFINSSFVTEPFFIANHSVAKLFTHLRVIYIFFRYVHCPYSR